MFASIISTTCEFAKFWWNCIHDGWEIGDGIFGAIIEASLLISGFLLLLKHFYKKIKWDEQWKNWEDGLMKIAFVIFSISFLVATIFIAPFLMYSDVVSQKLATALQIPPKKPLPTKTIPIPEPMPVIMESAQTQNVVAIKNMGPLVSYDTDDAGTNDFKGEYAKLQAQRDAEKAADEKAKRETIQKWWDDYLPYYRQALVVLHDQMMQWAKNAGDGIDQSSNYFQCLPSNIDPSIGDFKPAEIRLRKNPNMDFIVTISALGSDHRRMIISCSSNSLEMDGGWGEAFYATLYTPLFAEPTNVPQTTNADGMLKHSIKELLSAQAYFTNPNNK